jgi:hypothetical protein
VFLYFTIRKVEPMQGSQTSPNNAQAARALQKCGVDFTVFEAYDDVGGVWRANYMDYRLQGILQGGKNEHQGPRIMHKAAVQDFRMCQYQHLFA